MIRLRGPILTVYGLVGAVCLGGFVTSRNPDWLYGVLADMVALAVVINWAQRHR